IDPGQVPAPLCARLPVVSLGGKLCGAGLVSHLGWAAPSTTRRGASLCPLQCVITGRRGPGARASSPPKSWGTKLTRSKCKFHSYSATIRWLLKGSPSPQQTTGLTPSYPDPAAEADMDGGALSFLGTPCILE
uniref:Uncharacterized protein n=1 Tax=Terrapene triunguis TaxID=2587831 RepID=A0A674KIJ1_9SAUR